MHLKNKKIEESAHKKSESALKERVKELSCLYSITNISIAPDILLEDVLNKIVNIIPPSWQYTEITCCRLIINSI